MVISNVASLTQNSMNKIDGQPLPDGIKPSGKYIYLAIAAFWLAGIIVAGYILALPHGVELRFDLLRALLVSYLFGISLLVSHNYCRNIGPSLLFSILLPCVPLAVGVPLLFPLFALGLSMLAWLRRSNISDSVGHIGMTEIAALIVTASAFAAITLTATQAGGAFFVSDVRYDFLNTDALYHSALTETIKNYGVSSTGLNGLVERHYHIFSHIVFAAASFGTGLSAMSSFGLLQFILIEPLLLLAIVATSETVRPSSNARSFYIRIAALFVAFQMIAAWPVFGQFSLADSYFISQSYALSLILMLATICAMQMERENYRLLTLIALALLTAASKISTGAICIALVSIHLAWLDPSDRARRFATWITLMTGFGALLYLFGWSNKISDQFDHLDISSILKYSLVAIIAISITTATLIALSRRSAFVAPTWRRLGRLPAFIVGILIGILGILLSILLDSFIIKSGTFMQIYGGIPINSHTPGFWLALGKFTLVHFCFTWLLVALAGILYLIDKNKTKYLIAPLLYSIAALIISWAVLLLTELGSAEFYFTNVAMFIALPYLLTTISEPIRDGITASITEGALATLIVILLWTLAGDWNQCYSRGTAVNLFRRMSCNLPVGINNSYSHIVDLLDEIRRDNSTRKLGVYIAREESDFWVAGHPNCLQRPFVIPAVSERPGLLALPDLSCNPRNSGYGFYDYTDEEYAISALPRVSHEVLMSIAQKAGLEGYVDVTKKGWTIYKLDNDAVAVPAKKLLAK